MHELDQNGPDQTGPDQTGLGSLEINWNQWKLMKTNDKSIKHRQHLFSLQGWQFSASLCFELRWQITTPTDGQIEKFLSRCWITSTTSRMWVWGKRKKNKHQLMANNINQQPPGCDCEEEPVMQCYTGNCTNYHDCRSLSPSPSVLVVVANTIE